VLLDYVLADHKATDTTAADRFFVLDGIKSLGSISEELVEQIESATSYPNLVEILSASPLPFAHRELLEDRLSIYHTCSLLLQGYDPNQITFKFPNKVLVVGTTEFQKHFESLFGWKPVCSGEITFETLDVRHALLLSDEVVEQVSEKITRFLSGGK